MALSVVRLQEERLVPLPCRYTFVHLSPCDFADPCHIIYSKAWRKDPMFGFFARPSRNAQNILDLKTWDCGVPGKEGTIWEGGVMKLTITFPEGQSIFLLADQPSLNLVC